MITTLILLNVCHWLGDYTHLSTAWMLSAKRLGKPLLPILAQEVRDALYAANEEINRTNSNSLSDGSGFRAMPREAIEVAQWRAKREELFKKMICQIIPEFRLQFHKGNTEFRINILDENHFIVHGLGFDSKTIDIEW